MPKSENGTLFLDFPSHLDPAIDRLTKSMVRMWSIKGVAVAGGMPFGDGHYRLGSANAEVTGHCIFVVGKERHDVAQLFHVLRDFELWKKYSDKLVDGKHVLELRPEA